MGNGDQLCRYYQNEYILHFIYSYQHPVTVTQYFSKNLLPNFFFLYCDEIFQKFSQVIS